VVTLDACDRPAPCVGRHAERIALALHDEHGHLNGIELGQPRLLGPSGRMHREGEAEHGDSSRLGGGSARDARAERPAARNERELADLVIPELHDDGRPRRVELRGGCRRAPAGNAVRLLDESDRDLLLEGHLLCDDEVGSGYASARAVPEDEERARLVGDVHDHARGAVRCGYLSCHGFA
jgi:hypothetical protein